MAQLQVWLHEHKEYPRGARNRRQEGTVLLAFVMDREGRVLEHRIRQGSGHRLLDEEVVALIRRANPLPPPPPEIPGNRISFVVPVQFFLR
jgi:protein TonB